MAVCIRAVAPDIQQQNRTSQGNRNKPRQEQPDHAGYTERRIARAASHAARPMADGAAVE
jgi:hypothetical protein